MASHAAVGESPNDPDSPQGEAETVPYRWVCNQRDERGLAYVELNLSEDPDPHPNLDPLQVVIPTNSLHIVEIP